MLQLILGRAGTGKLYRLSQQIADVIQSGDSAPILLIVPEQASFDTERFLLSRLGATDAQRVQVFSFTRLAETVLQTSGRRTATVDDGSRLLLLAYAADCVADHLELYRKQVRTPEGLMPLKHLLTECKQATVTPAALLAVSERLSDSILSKKLRECALLFDAYDALLADRYFDPLDNLAAAAAHLTENPLYAGAHVYLDSFTGFTAGEYALLEPLMKQAASFTVTLCLDPQSDETTLFSMPRQTAKRLKDMAERLSVPSAEDVPLPHKPRANPVLDMIEQNLFLSKPDTLDQETTAVTVNPCHTVWEESELVARTVKTMVRDGLRYRDIAVAMRNPDSYNGILDAAMDRMGVPYFWDQPDTIMHDPLVTLLKGALKAITGRCETDDLLAMVKTGLLGVSTGSLGKLENYIFTWQIPYSRFRTVWSWSPDGIEQTRDAAATLAFLNRLRRRIITPLDTLCRTCSGKKMTGKAFADAVYRYLTDAAADRMTAFIAGRYWQAGMATDAERLTRVWDLVMEQLDKIATLFEKTRLSADRLADLLITALKAVEFGSIPQSVDSVQIGCPDRMRFSHPKAVLLLGVNEGVFPAYPTAGHVFDETEREALLHEGLELGVTLDDRYDEEEFFAYTAATEPDIYLHLFYLIGTNGGNTLYPSSMIRSIRRILPKVGPLSLPPITMPENRRDAVSLFAAHMGSTYGASLREVLKKDDADADARLSALCDSARRLPIRFADAAEARRFFGNRLTVSATAAEAFYGCRFRYFCQQGLQIRERRQAELDALTFGNIQHYVMETLIPLYRDEGFDNVTEARVKRDVAAQIDRYVSEKLGGYENKPARFAGTVKRLCRFAAAMLWQTVLEFRQSLFVPVYYELPIDERVPANVSHVDPTVLYTEDGASIRVTGKIDRVDIATIEGETYARVVDYKTGRKDFKIEEAVGGTSLQMLLYLFSLCRQGVPSYGAARPAGILYLAADMKPVDGEGLSPDAIQKERMRHQRMNGLILNELSVVRAMEADGEGLFIPAQLTAKGETTKRSTVATEDQFAQLEEHIRSLLVKMADLLRTGDVAAVPTVHKNDSACDYCPFYAACGFEEGDAVNRLMTDKNEVWAYLEKKEGKKDE